LFTVMREHWYCSVSSCSKGMRWPGGHSPERILPSTSSRMRRCSDGSLASACLLSPRVEMVASALAGRRFARSGKVIGKAGLPFNTSSGLGQGPHGGREAPADRRAHHMAAVLDLPAAIHPDAIDRRAIGEDPAVEQRVAGKVEAAAGLAAGEIGGAGGRKARLAAARRPPAAPPARAEPPAR